MLAPLLSSILLLAPAQTPAGEATAGAKKAEPEGKEPERSKEAPEEKPVVTQHTLRAGGKTLAYNVTTGLMPLKNEAGAVTELDMAGSCDALRAQRTSPEHSE